MLELDGGAGGGQQVRTALSLAAIEGRPIRVENVRAERPDPGLKAQHVAAVEAVAAATEATVEDVEVGGDAFTFEPTAAPGGEFAVDVGTAGSATLVCDALLPLAVALREPLTARVTGGTDVKWSPMVDYLRHAKIPLLRAVGVDADLAVERRGFYPAGGGTLSLTVRPSSLSELRLRERGPVRGLSARAVAADSLESASVAERMAAAADDRTAVPTATAATYTETASPGAVLTLVADCGDSRAGYGVLGERGVPAESVAEEAVEAFREWRATGAAVDEHLGDQLLPWVALAGGAVRMPRVTDHVRTNAAVIRAFGYELDVEEADGGAVASAPLER
ncbi:RNA 3'-terminal-phosphate cyclase [Halogeometricum pallidum JCM 14848]|uniref:RNA 3'-terminal phosphate cyclase n=1 Tax=Halogeometricum pallidum JCM 14848 TaxID=1227487 RepID=M0D2N1_HALPD|nr:RNA 3'-terminal phosphate cyclase [Halogeometricum pallidum]ELZ29781.1 RNA 3'-terminal-phosphate cyclase [Halogeometricum pallidum JCM 14848]